MAAFDGVILSRAYGACGNYPDGVVFILDIATGDALAALGATAEWTHLGYELAAGGPSGEIVLSWEDDLGSGVVVTDPQLVPLATITSPETYHAFGLAVAWADRYLVVGDPYAEDREGALWVFDTPLSGEVDPASAVAIKSGTEADPGLGSYVFSVGDVDGDGSSDIVSISDWTTALLLGADLTLDGPIDGGLTYPVWAPRDQSVAALGDIDGDGLGDVGIGDYSKRAAKGEVAIFGTDTSFPFARLYDATYSDVRWGAGQGGIGDPDGDGWDEAVIAGFDDRLGYPPQFWLVEGPFCGTVDIPEVSIALTPNDAPLIGPGVFTSDRVAAYPASDWDGGGRIGLWTWGE